MRQAATTPLIRNGAYEWATRRGRPISSTLHFFAAIHALVRDVQEGGGDLSRVAIEGVFGVDGGAEGSADGDIATLDVEGFADGLLEALFEQIDAGVGFDWRGDDDELVAA